jgi:uncharacterized protein (TIGR02118 family)
MARMVVIYKTPEDPAAFEKHYLETHVPLAQKLPGLRKYEISRAPIVTFGGATDIYLIATLLFDDMAAIQACFASPEGRAARADRELLAPRDADYEMFLFDTDEVHEATARNFRAVQLTPQLTN